MRGGQGLGVVQHGGQSLSRAKGTHMRMGGGPLGCQSPSGVRKASGWGQPEQGVTAEWSEEMSVREWAGPRRWSLDGRRRLSALRGEEGRPWAVTAMAT